MAALDKMKEFYTCTDRFIFLAACYRPEELPDEINMCLDVIIRHFSNNREFKEKVEDAEDYFEASNDRMQMLSRKEILAELVKELCQ